MLLDSNIAPNDGAFSGVVTPISNHLIPLCSGKGQYFSVERGDAYLDLTLQDIEAMLDHPQNVEKRLSKWVTFSSLNSRSKSEQIKIGRFYAVWLDIDEHTPLAKLEPFLTGLGFKCMIYSTKSSKPDFQKWRVIFPLAETISGADYQIYAEILNVKLQEAAIKPDFRTQNANQLCFLPNEGDFYTSFVMDGELLDCRKTFQAEYQTKIDAIEAARVVCEAKRQENAARKVKLESEGKIDCITAVNEAYNLEDKLEQHGFEQHGNKWLSPHSTTGSAGVTVFDGDAWYSCHESDLEAGLGRPAKKGGCFGDCFDIIKFFKFKNDHDATLKGLGDLLTTAEGLTINAHNQRVHMARKELDLLRHLPENSLLRRYSAYVGGLTDIPCSTILMVGLGVYSSMACRYWACRYENGSKLPIGLYVAAEQPSGASKSWSMRKFEDPFNDAQAKKVAALKEQISALDDLDEPSPDQKREVKKLKLSLKGAMRGGFVSNTTSEGLEASLSLTGGYFSAISSEQSLLDVAFGLLYKDKSAKPMNNNEIWLCGFDAGHVNSMRVTRDGYCGQVIGGIACFAQPGSIEKIMGVSGGTGLSERFLMIGEPHRLGSRDHLRDRPLNLNLEAEYAKACRFAEKEHESFDKITALYFTEAGYRLISEFRNKIEPDLRDGGRFSHISLRGAASKLDMQTMKLAANLHVFEGGNGPHIDDKWVKVAIAIVEELMEANLRLCGTKELIGNKAEESAIIRYLDNRSEVKESALVETIKNRRPFSDMTTNPRQAVRSTVKSMLDAGKLTLENGLLKLA